MAARFPLPADLTREELASPGDAVARMVRLESAVERVMTGVLRDFLRSVEALAIRDGLSMTLGGVWMNWSQLFGAAIAELPPVVGAWLASSVGESDIPDAAYDSALAVLVTAQTEGWSARTRDDQVRLALRPTEGETSLVAAASRRGPRNGARWGDLDVGGLTFMERMKRDARTAITGLDGILTSSALRDQGFTRKRWVTRHDAKVRASHVEVEGDTVPLDEHFIVGGYPLMYPGERGAPPAIVINCVIGSTQVEWTGDLHAISAREFTGTFYKITTARGHELTVTPNHPVLSRTGYVAAELVREGDYLMASLDPPSPEVDNAPPSVEQLQASARKLRPAARVRGARVDFHGDGSDAEVEIVGGYGDLRFELDAALPRQGGEAEFVGMLDRATSLSGLRGQNVPIAGRSIRNFDDGAPGLLSGSRVVSPFLRGEPSIAEVVRFARVSDWQADPPERPSDWGPTDAESLRHLEDAHALGMQLCEVVKVERFTGRHAVYNLSTSESWYIGSGIAQHNCRCTMVGTRWRARGPGGRGVGLAP